MRRPGCWAALLLCVAALAAHAQETVTVNLPLNGVQITGPGLVAPPRQVTTPDGLGYLEVLLRPLRGAPHIFLTVVFQEVEGKGPAVFWSGDASGKQSTLSTDLGEGVAGPNRRTIELPEEVGSEAGRLYIVGRQEDLLRVRIDWSEPMETFVAADQEQPRWIQGGAIQHGRDLDGQQPLTPPDAWFGPVLDAALQDGVADLSQDTELVVPLKGVASQVRLRAKFLGLPLGRAVRVWVNGKFAGRMQPEIPSLTDPAYVRRGKRATYAGWREGAIFIDPTALVEGENSIILQSPGKGVYLSGAAIEIEAAVEEAPPEQAVASPAPEPSATSAPEASPMPQPAQAAAPELAPVPDTGFRPEP